MKKAFESRCLLITTLAILLSMGFASAHGNESKGVCGCGMAQCEHNGNHDEMHKMMHGDTFGNLDVTHDEMHKMMHGNSLGDVDLGGMQNMMDGNSFNNGMHRSMRSEPTWFNKFFNRVFGG